MHTLHNVKQKNEKKSIMDASLNIAYHTTTNATGQPLHSPPRPRRKQVRSTPKSRPRRTFAILRNFPLLSCDIPPSASLTPSGPSHRFTAVGTWLRSSLKFFTIPVAIPPHPHGICCLLRMAARIERRCGARNLLHQGNLLVAAPLKSVKVVRRRNRSIEHRVQFNGLVFGHKRGDTGRDFVRTQVVGPGHHLILDNARRYDLHGQFFPFVPDALAACRPNFWQVDRFRSALLGLPCQRMPELLWRNRRPQCLQDPSHPRPRIWRTRSRSV